MGLVHYNELRAGAQEVVAPPVGLHEVRRDYDVRVAIEDGLACAQVTLQALGGTGEDLLRLDVELLAQLRLPLSGELGRAEYGEPVGLPPVQELAGDKARLDRLADTDVVGDQDAHRVELQRHQKRD